MSKKLWWVWNRKPLGRNERQVRVHQYVTCASSPSQAISNVQQELSRIEGSWHVRQVEAAYVGVSISHQDPTEEEIKERRSV